MCKSIELDILTFPHTLPPSHPFFSHSPLPSPLSLPPSLPHLPLSLNPSPPSLSPSPPSFPHPSPSLPPSLTSLSPLIPHLPPSLPHLPPSLPQDIGVQGYSTLHCIRGVEIRPAIPSQKPIDLTKMESQLVHMNIAQSPEEAPPTLPSGEGI